MTDGSDWARVDGRGKWHRVARATQGSCPTLHLHFACGRATTTWHDLEDSPAPPETERCRGCDRVERQQQEARP